MGEYDLRQIERGNYMKKMIGWTLLMPAMAVAVIATAVMVWAHVCPHIASMKLLNLTILAGRVSFGGMGFTLFVALTVLTVRWFRRRTLQWKIGLVGPLPWYLPACQIIAVVAFFEFFLSSSAEIQYVAGKWMMGGGRGYPWQEVSEQVAVVCLWGNLRSNAAFLLFITMMWMLFAGTLITSKR